MMNSKLLARIKSVPRSDWLIAIGALIASALFGAAVSYFSGQDVNWDWRNYHDYAAWALWNDRYDTDVAPSGIQTFLNPIPYIPGYYLMNVVPSPFGHLTLGAIHGLNLFLVYALARVVFADQSRRLALTFSLIAVVISASGPIFRSEIGTSFIDVLTSLLILAGLCVCLRDHSNRLWVIALAGASIGLAVGLKLTNAPFAIAAAAVCALHARPVGSVVALAVGGAGAGLVSTGAWTITLWIEYANPLFPHFNAIFGSFEAHPQSISDDRFKADGLSEALAYPWLWLAGQHPTSEVAFRDARFALLYVIGAAFAGAWLQRREILRPADARLIIFVVISYVIWMYLFSIHRYMVVLELISGPLIVLLLARMLPTRYAAVAASAAGLAIVVWSEPANWGRTPWSDPYLGPQIPAEIMAQEDAAFVMVTKPLGYVARHLPESARLINISDPDIPIEKPGTILFERAIRIITESDSAWSIGIEGGYNRYDLLPHYGLRLPENPTCRYAVAADRATIEICRLEVAQ